MPFRMSSDPLSAAAPELWTGPELSDEALERGFGGDRRRLRAFVAALRAVLPSDTVIVLRGSTVGGRSYETGAAFDAAGPGTSDLDVVLIGQEVMGLWSADAQLMGGINTVPLCDASPDIAPTIESARRSAQAIAGRPVSIQAMPSWFLLLRALVQDQPYAVLSQGS